MWVEQCNSVVVVLHMSWCYVLFLFWLVVMSWLSSWDKMNVCVKLLAYDVWVAENDKTGFLSVVLDSLDWLHLKGRPIYLPMVQISTKNKNMTNVDKWESSTNRNIRFFMNYQNIMFRLTPYGKTRKNQKCQSINFDECPN